MPRKTKAQRDAETARQWDLHDRAAWRAYVAALGNISDPVAAQRLADSGPRNGRPGGRYYHNLGCFLHDNPLDRGDGLARSYNFATLADELAELIKFAERAEAAGCFKPGTADTLRAQLERQRRED